MKQFANQVVVVTGGASGIGAATCRAFAQSGARVVVTARNRTKGVNFSQSLRGAEFVCLDVTDEEQWIECFNYVSDRYGRLDVVVNSAGASLRTNVESTSLAQWNSIIETNMTGVFLGCKHAVRTMRELKCRGAIVNIGSLGSVLGSEDAIGYCVSKAGMHSLTKSTALYCAKHNLGIRCNSVLPTATDTEMMSRYSASMGGAQEMAATMARRIPLGRMVTPEEVAAAVVFLVGPQAAMITGVGLPVDGGVLTAF